MRRITDIGILCSGRSLARLPEISGNFRHCFVVNLFGKESSLIGKYIDGKEITYFLNADQRPWDVKAVGSIEGNKAIVAWTKSMMYDPNIIKPKAKITMQELVEQFRKVLKICYMPEKYRATILRMRNLGTTGVRFVAEELHPDTIWIAGLDFYCCDYLIKKPLSERHKTKIRKGWVKQLSEFFIDTVMAFPEIQFNIITEYTELPERPNLKVL